MAFDEYFKIYSVLCLHNPFDNKYSYVVQTTGGGLSYFSRELCPSMVLKFLELHNKQEFCVFLDWHNYIVYADPVPLPEGG